MTSIPVETIRTNPHYVDGSCPGEVWAHFQSGAVVRAVRNRSCHFPGLSGSAPATLGFYRRFDALSVPANHVLDAGCGTGEGLRHISAAYRRVTGIDRSTSALSCARELAPASRLLHADLAAFELHADTAQVAYIVDVLGQVASPVPTLLRIGQSLEGARGLCVAEPSVAVGQCLEPPACRAFSARSLHSLLVRGGFQVEEWLSGQPEFVTCYAVACRDRNVAILHSAEAHLELGRFHIAELLAKRACSTDTLALRFEALLTLGRVQVQQSRRDAATATLVEARQLDPTDARAPAGLSVLARIAGAESQAFALAQGAVALDPTELAAVISLASLLHDSNPKQALVHWTTAHALAPDHARVVAHLCESAVRVGDCGRAIVALEQSRRFDAGARGVKSSLSLAWLLAHVGRSEQAANIARLTAKMDPNAPSLDELRDYLKTRSSS